MSPLVRKIIAGVVVAAFILVLVTLNSCQTARTAKTEAKLSGNQTGAAIASGKDAVDTLGKSAASEAATDIITKENDRAIRNAPGADAPVDPAAHAAGIASLCRRAANRGKPECLQQPAP